MKECRIKILIPLFLVVLLTGACVEKAPSRDEIPLIKSLLKDFETAVVEKNSARMDSLMTAEAVELGYSSDKILKGVYDTESESFYKFGGLDITYLPKKGLVKFQIMADSADTGRPAEITLIKKGDRWLVKKFDFK
ncbi:MAG: hypothetical protein ABIJ45_04775 [Candidatus Zixiibacteriota bacterium]